MLSIGRLTCLLVYKGFTSILGLSRVFFFSLLALCTNSRNPCPINNSILPCWIWIIVHIVSYGMYFEIVEIFGLISILCDVH